MHVGSNSQHAAEDVSTFYFCPSLMHFVQNTISETKEDSLSGSESDELLSISKKRHHCPLGSDSDTVEFYSVVSSLICLCNMEFQFSVFYIATKNAPR